MGDSISVFFPAYNDEHTIGELVRKTLRHSARTLYASLVRLPQMTLRDARSVTSV